MEQDIIERLIAGSYPDPDGGPPLQVDTRSVVITRSIAGSEADVLKPLGLTGRFAVVSDRTTHGLLGARVERALAGLGQVTSVILPEHPHADDATVEGLHAATAAADVLVAVGSGTINDLCKYVSAQDGKPYVVYGTAPSMNGYVSVNAAITVGGLKKSLAAQAPLGVFLDLSILAAAPPRMIRSGLGDSLCRPTAQADWLLAHLLFDQPYRTMPFVLLEEDESALLAGAGALMKGDLAAMERLVRTLLLSGFGTAICGSSLPASQGEHLISHYIDMLPAPDQPFSFHGEQIGVTTLTSARLQERLLEGPPPVLLANADSEADFIQRFGASLGPSCWREFAQKRLTGERLDAANARIAGNWEKIGQAIRKITLPAAFLSQVLANAGAPRTPQELGWPTSFYATAVKRAREIRNRYTFLDLAADSKLLDEVMPAIV